MPRLLSQRRVDEQRLTAAGFEGRFPRRAASSVHVRCQVALVNPVMTPATCFGEAIPATQCRTLASLSRIVTSRESVDQLEIHGRARRPPVQRHVFGTREGTHCALRRS